MIAFQINRMSLLCEDEIARYARHIVLPEFGGTGQQQLKQAQVLVIGAGGLGAPVLIYLAAAGVGHLHIADDDEVSLSNLQRQIIHGTNNIGELKTVSARKTLERINPHTQIYTHNSRINLDNGPDLIGPVDLVLDGSDNFDTRYLLADLCDELKTPLISGAVSRFDGSLTVLCPWLKGEDGLLNPRYRDLFPQRPKEGSVPTCAQAGIIGALTGIIGTLMAMEAIKVITQTGAPLIRRLLLYDSLNARMQTINYERNRD